MPAPTHLPEPPLAHFDLIKNNLPRWLITSPAHKRLALQAVEPGAALPPNDLTPAQHQALNRAHEAHWQSHNHIETLLKDLQDIHAFARPRLIKALQATYNIDPTPDLQRTFINLRAPLKAPMINLNTGGVHISSVSMLDAALHNFEAFEAHTDAHTAESGFITQPDDLGRYTLLHELNQQLPVAGFIALCRTVDIGGQYKAHLEEHLAVGDTTKELHLKTALRQSFRTAFEAAMHYALAHKAITRGTFDSLSSLGQTPGWTSAPPAPLYPYSLRLFDTPLTGILLFCGTPDAAPNQAEIVAYLPDDPYQPLKRYTSLSAFLSALALNLRDDRYRQFFSRFVDHAQLGTFFAALNNALYRTQTDPAQVPEGRPEDHPPDIRITAIAEPVLPFALHPVAEDYSHYLYREKRRKILVDAASIAVPTDTQDRKTRREHKARLKALGLNVLMAVEFVAAPFVPVVGQLVLLQMAYQVLDDTYEGIRDWTQGKTLEAWNHLFGVVETVVQTAALGIGAAVVKAAQTLKPSPFIEGLQPVTLPTDETRLWKPDLTPYAHTEPLPLDLEPNDAVLLAQGNQQFLRLDDTLYRVEQAPRTGHYHIKHPTRPQAYAPRLQHNGLGAWTAETEQPLAWSDVQLFKRLSPTHAEFSDTHISRILEITQTDAGVLRQIHAESLPMPGLLADTAQRLRIDQDIQRFIQQMESADLATRRLADPQTQLQLLTSPDLWPDSQALQIVGEQGQVLSEYPAAPASTPRIRLSETQLRAGDWQSSLLLALDDATAWQLIGLSSASGQPLPDLPTRVSLLCNRLARAARNKRIELFTSRYATLEQRANQEVMLLQKTVPGLPTPAAQELIWHANGDELLALLNHRSVPARLLEEARLLQAQSRVNRAYEGLFLNTAITPDSEWLTLKTLETLPGWPRDVRLEIRTGTVDGPLRNALGDDNAPIRRVLLASNNRYSAWEAQHLKLHDADDFYSAVLHALPDTAHQTLGLPETGQSTALRDAVRQQPLLPRLPVSLYLEQPRVAEGFISPMRLARGRITYPLLGADAPQSPQPTLDQLARRLYPTISLNERARILAALPSNEIMARRALADLERELQRMRADLIDWISRTPLIDPETGLLLDAHVQAARIRDRRSISRTIMSCWRRQTAFDNHYADPARDGFELATPPAITHEMPHLEADFSHVTYMVLNGQGVVTGVNGFLQRFPKLRYLNLYDFALEHLPESISAMPNLTEIDLKNTHLSLTQTSAEIVSGLEKLEFLDLDNNPLTHAPTFSNMPDLKYLYLRNTSLTEFPASLLNLSELDVVDLRDNLIVTIPTDVLEAPLEVTSSLKLQGNPLSEESLDLLRRYYLQTGINMGTITDGLQPIGLPEPEV